jgi:tripartite-type tricarboxylate transporter receptor subunit TctC
MKPIIFQGDEPFYRIRSRAMVQVLFTAVPAALPHIEGGKLRALMVTSEKRVAALAEVPSAAETGAPKMIAHYWVGFSASAKTWTGCTRRSSLL